MNDPELSTVKISPKSISQMGGYREAIFVPSEQIVSVKLINGSQAHLLPFLWMPQLISTNYIFIFLAKQVSCR
jgi:hypothetical protein